jgi:hypothetical protein
VKLKLLFEPRDLWLGVYWNRKVLLGAELPPRVDLHVYICLVPMFPIHIVFKGEE